MSWHWCFTGLTVWLHNFHRPSEATHKQASVCEECCHTADFQSLLSKPYSAVTAQITPWLRMPERISIWLAVLVYCCLHGSAPGYLASDLQHLSHLNALVTPNTVRSTIGDCIFLVTALLCVLAVLGLTVISLLQINPTLCTANQIHPILQIVTPPLKAKTFTEATRITGGLSKHR